MPDVGDIVTISRKERQITGADNLTGKSKLALHAVICLENLKASGRDDQHAFGRMIKNCLKSLFGDFIVFMRSYADHG